MTEARRPPHRRGAGLAVLTALVQTVGTAIAAHGQLHTWGYVLLAVSGLALADRHKTPRLTFLTVATLTMVYQALHYPAGPTFLAFLIAGSALMRAKRSGFAWFFTLVWFVIWFLLVHPAHASDRVGGAIELAAWGLGIGLAAEFVFYAVPQIRQMISEQQRMHQERQRRQITEERLRIAHELHDVLGHHLSLINIQAGVGLHLRDRKPEEAWAALETIKKASAEALREVQAMLHTLRPTDEATPRAPAPGLDRLDELIVGAGLPVRSAVTGEPRPVPPEVDRAAYRIVQETLTNVRRHAGPTATAVVALDYRPEELVIQVDDDGGEPARRPSGAAGLASLAGLAPSPPTPAPAEPGNGINGMRERAKALGGTLVAGPRPEGGWRVRVRLPLPAPAEAAAPVTEGATEDGASEGEP